MDEEVKKVLTAIRPQSKVEEITVELCKVFAGKGLTFRQAEAVILSVQEHLKDFKMG